MLSKTRMKHNSLFDRISGLVSKASFTVIAASATSVFSQVAGIETGWDMTVIGSPGNIAYTPPPNPLQPPVPASSGRVDYSFRISRTELRTSQWVEFVNTFPLIAGSSQWIPGSWGALTDFSTPAGARRYYVPTEFPDAVNYPVLGINAVASAAYCNWLCNGKSTDPISLRSGAYDIGTYIDTRTFPVRYTRMANATYFMPSLDELTKAFYYDPNRYGPGQEGYWKYNNSSDTPPIWAAPQNGGTANAGFFTGDPFIPVGAYPIVQTPWGLLDAAGGGGFEWTDTQHPFYPDGALYTRGSTQYDTNVNVDGIDITRQIAGFASVGTLRLAAIIPAPSTAIIAAAFLASISVRRRREPFASL